MISIIVAVAENYAIGKKGDLLCHLPADLKHFKEITSGKTVMMGERTFFSLPKHPLPNRRNIVLTDVAGKTFEGAEAVYSLDEMEAKVQGEEEAFVIGGGMVYRQMDTFFPEIKEDEWTLVSSEKHQADEKNPYDFTFCTYNRRQH